MTGNTINVAGTDASGNTTQTAVTVDDQTKYSKLTTATPDAIAQGKCVNARGTLDNGGTLQATTIKLRPANDGKCGGPRAAAPRWVIALTSTNALVRNRAPVGTRLRRLNGRSEKRRCLPSRADPD